MNKNVQYSRKIALNQRECKLLLRGVREVDCIIFKFESQSIAFHGGRAGIGPDKTTHIHKDRLNWRRYRIAILRNDSYNQSRESGLCDSCRQPIRQRTEYHGITLGEAQMEIVKFVQLIDALQEPVLLLTPKDERFAQGADL